MNICLIMDNPETPRHPVIAVALQQLSTRHAVRLFDVRTLTGTEAIVQEEASQQPLADIYLLKSHAPQALDLALHLEQQGALVVNSWASSMACQDRVLMAQRMNDAHLPWPQTESFPSLDNLIAQPERIATLIFPLIIKSYYSHRGDLVDKVRSSEELRTLAGQWGQEPVVIQEFAAGDGWDIKLWVIDQQIFAARRRTPLDPEAPKRITPSVQKSYRKSGRASRSKSDTPLTCVFTALTCSSVSAGQSSLMSIRSPVFVASPVPIAPWQHSWSAC